MVRAGEVGWFWEALSQLLFLRRGGPEAKKKVNERGERQAVYIRGWNLNRGGLGVVADGNWGSFLLLLSLVSSMLMLGDVIDTRFKG